MYKRFIDFSSFQKSVLLYLGFENKYYKVSELRKIFLWHGQKYIRDQCRELSVLQLIKFKFNSKDRGLKFLITRKGLNLIIKNFDYLIGLKEVKMLPFYKRYSKEFIKNKLIQEKERLLKKKLKIKINQQRNGV